MLSKIRVVSKDSQFYSNACFVCRAYGKDVELRRCTNCKMVAYCSEEHQKEHWPEHKPLCQILSEKLRCSVGYGMPPCWENSKLNWSKVKRAVGRAVQNSITKRECRDVLTSEVEILLFPRCCEICHETDSRKLVSCTDCPDASFCNEHPKDSKHSTTCKASILYFLTNNATPNFNDMQSINLGETFPRNMTKAVSLFAAQYPADKMGEPVDIWSTILTFFITRPYTFMFAMQKLSRPESPKITIHMIGADQIDADTVQWWHHIFHHNPTLQQVKLIYIGIKFGIPDSDSILCDECIKNKRRIHIHTAAISYKEYVACRFFAKPDYAVAFNIQFEKLDRSENDPWTSSIKAVAEIGCPFIATSFYARIAKKNEHGMKLILRKRVKSFWSGKNPFSGKLPHKNMEYGTFMYDNQYINIYQKLH